MTALIFGFLLLFPVVSATEPLAGPCPPFPPNHYVCYRADTPLEIDGKLDEPAWVKAPWTGAFVDIEGPGKPEPRFKTRAKMLWDDTYFYLAADLEEPHLWGTLSERDSVIYYDHDFEIFIDPDGDTHHYFELEINALGTVWDLFLDRPYRDGSHPLFFWDIRGLKSAVHLEGTLNNPADQDRGWFVEVAIPWAVLKECAPGNRPPRPGEQWRVNFSRVEWQMQVKDGQYAKVLNPDTGKSLPENNWVWSPQGAIAMHQPETWGFVQFSDRAAGAEAEPFLPLAQEQAKWALRRVYLAEKVFFERHGHYTASISDLGLDQMQVPGYQWPPRIRHTFNFFEACMEKQGGGEKWHIGHDGRVWKQ